MLGGYDVCSKEIGVDEVGQEVEEEEEMGRCGRENRFI